MKSVRHALLTCLVLFATVTAANASPITGTYTLGGATTGTGPWDMTSTDATFSILRFVFDTPVLFSDLASLSVSYDAVLGGIAGGAPRIVIVTDSNNDNIADGQFTIHWGPAGSFASASLGVASTGNLLALLDVGRYDLGGIGGSAYTDRAAALSLGGNLSVLRASLVIDSFGGADRHFIIGDISAQSATAAVPEPATLSLMGIGLIGLASRVRKMRKTTNKS